MGTAPGTAPGTGSGTAPVDGWETRVTVAVPCGREHSVLLPDLRQPSVGTRLPLRVSGGHSTMPRLRRCVEPRDVLHVFNRSVNRDTLFHAADDYAYFIDLVLESRRRFGLEVFAFCAMPNHWHLLLRAEATDDLSASLHWITFRHATYFRAVQKSVGNGHVYQGRFHSKVIVGDRYFVTAARYIETNPVRAGLADTADEWTWSSVCHRAKHELDAPPILASSRVDSRPERCRRGDGASAGAPTQPSAPARRCSTRRTSRWRGWRKEDTRSEESATTSRTRRASDECEWWRAWRVPGSCRRALVQRSCLGSAPPESSS